MSRLLSTGTLIASLIATWLFAVCLTGCQEDLGIEERAFRCSDESECLPGFECLPVGGTSELKQCVRASQGTDASDARTSDTDSSDADKDAQLAPDADAALDASTDAAACPSQPCPGEQECIDGACVLTGRHYLLIEDLSSINATECTGSGSPGTDLFAIALLDEEGSQIAMGRVVTADIKSLGNNQHSDTAVLDDAADATCATEADSRSYVSLGCRGSVFLNFEDSSSNPVSLLTGRQLVIGEYNEDCSETAPAPEEYRLSRCESDGSNCIIFGGNNLSGPKTITLN